VRLDLRAAEGEAEVRMGRDVNGPQRKAMGCGGYYCSGEHNLGNEGDIAV